MQCFRAPRYYFNHEGWSNTVGSATEGVSPVGGKSLLPVAWTGDDIIKAILAVLTDPNAVVVRRRVSRNGEPMFFLRAHTNNVDIEVGFEGGVVRAAFPSWRQKRARTIGSAYLEWLMAQDRLKEQIDDSAVREPLLRKVSFPLGFVSGYLGKAAEGVSEAEWQTLQPWLDPKEVKNATKRQEALTLQLLIFEWLAASRATRELEGLRGPMC